MTYVVAWRQPDAVFLLADSALTEEVSTIPESAGITPFGEAYLSEQRRFVRDGAIKIVNLGSVAVAFSGNSYYCYNCAEQMKTRLAFGARPAEAVRGVLEDWLDPRAQLSLVATFLGTDGPTMLAFNADGRRKVQELPTGAVLQLGSAPSSIQVVSNTMIEHIVGIPSPQDRLAVMLSWIQSYGLKHLLIESGVGGAFAGLVCHAGGLEWHGDTLFLLVDDEGRPMQAVDSVVRQNAHVVSSTLKPDVHVAFSSVDRNEPFSVEWANQALSRARDGYYSYVALLNTVSNTVAVVAMNGELRHRDLLLNVTRRPDNKQELGISISPSLMNEFRRRVQGPPGGVPMRLLWRPQKLEREMGT